MYSHVQVSPAPPPDARKGHPYISRVPFPPVNVDTLHYGKTMDGTGWSGMGWKSPNVGMPLVGIRGGDGCGFDQPGIQDKTTPPASCISRPTPVYYAGTNKYNPPAVMKRSSLPGIAASRRVVQGRQSNAGEGRFGAGLNEWLHFHEVKKQGGTAHHAAQRCSPGPAHRHGFVPGRCC